MTHIYQTSMNSCIAACAAMVRNMLGEQVTEQEVIDGWGEIPCKGYQISRASRMPGARSQHLYFQDASDLAILEAMLRSHVAICVVFGGPMTVYYREHLPELRSPYGVLCATYKERDALMGQGLPQHAIVLIRSSNNSVEFFDPYHTSDHQPLLMDIEHFVLTASGEFFFFELV